MFYRVYEKVLIRLLWFFWCWINKYNINLRNDLQYYPDKLVDKESLNNIEKSVVDFLIKTKRFY